MSAVWNSLHQVRYNANLKMKVYRIYPYVYIIPPRVHVIISHSLQIQNPLSEHKFATRFKLRACERPEP
jgi:hypothetical protein